MCSVFSDLRGSYYTTEVHAVKSRKTQKFKKESVSSGIKKPLKNTFINPPSNRCDLCVKSPGHEHTNCPAKEATRHKCSKRGHWKSWKTVGEVEEEPSRNFWFVDLTQNNCSVYFKTDTGADETVIPERTYKMLQPLPLLAE